MTDLRKAIECCKKNDTEQTTKYCRECPLYSFGEKCLQEKDRLADEALKEHDKLLVECERLKLVAEAQMDVCDTIIKRFSEVIAKIGKEG